MSNLKPNTHGITGVAFGVISADVLDADTVDMLLFGRQAVNLSYERAKKEFIDERRREWDSDASLDEFDAEREADRFAEQYEGSEDSIVGEKNGVHYESSWIGGALHFFIYESPHTRMCAPCSPCIPGAGDLHNAGDLLAYDVPKEWRA